MLRSCIEAEAFDNRTDNEQGEKPQLSLPLTLNTRPAPPAKPPSEALQQELNLIATFVFQLQSS